MRAKVFISCGQRDAERDTARLVAQWLSKQGFEPYVAIEAQGIQDVNSGIIRELRRSDYYIFIDFRRERLPNDQSKPVYRGSLFSHQELAIVCGLQFEHTIFFRQSAVQLEGLAKYMASNATVFNRPNEVPALVAEAVQRREWNPRYSRNLVVDKLHFPPKPWSYADMSGRFLHVDIQNRRRDTGAGETVARLAAITLGSGTRKPSPNPSPLKVTGQWMAYKQTIWPRSHGAFDLLCVHAKVGYRVYLNSALDVAPRPILLEQRGEHFLEYEVFARGFDVRRFGVKLRLTAKCEEAEAELVPWVDDAS
jgi:hypothetical protein